MTSEIKIGQNNLTLMSTYDSRLSCMWLICSYLQLNLLHATGGDKRGEDCDFCLAPM